AREEVIQGAGPPDWAKEHALGWEKPAPAGERGAGAAEPAGGAPAGGEFERIMIVSQETPHLFPAAHTDFLMHCVRYKVPADKVGDLCRFDGSLQVERTRGLMSIMCDKESHNILALNLADDICTGKKTVDEARAAAAAAAQM